jgi:hypothetical protein
LAKWVPLAFKKALTPHNIWKGFEMTSMWPFNIDVMTSKMHPSKSFMEMQEPITTTTGGYFAIQISSQTTKKEISEISLLRTIIPRKLLTFCDTITFAPVPSQVLHNSRTW